MTVTDGALPPPLHARLARAVRALGSERLRSTYRTTFWFDLGAPSALPEEAALAVRDLLPRPASRAVIGVEWWLSRMDPGAVQVDFHQDRDERRHARTGETVHPAVTAVLFLNRCRGGLLAVTDAPANDANPSRAPDDLSALDLVRPHPNRLAVFPGDATHGVLDATGEIPHGRPRPVGSLRLAIVLNFWGRRPEGVPRFADAGRYAALRLERVSGSAAGRGTARRR